MGALGSVPKMNLKTNLKVIDVKISVGNDPEMCTVGVSKNFKKGARGVEERKSNRYVPWVPQEHHH